MRDSRLINVDMTKYKTSNKGTVMMISYPSVSKIYPSCAADIDGYIKACDKAIAELEKRKVSALNYYLTGELKRD